MYTLYIQPGSRVHQSFDWGFAQFSGDSREEIHLYTIPEEQWDVFQSEFDFGSFSRIHYFSMSEWNINSLNSVAKEVIRQKESSFSWPDDSFQTTAAIRDGNHLYILFQGGSSKEQEKRSSEISAIAIIRSYTEVLAIRVTHDELAEAAFNLLRETFSPPRTPFQKTRPNFRKAFRQEFTKRLVNRYTQVWFRTKGFSDPADVVHFQGSEDLRSSTLAKEFFDEHVLYAGYADISGVPNTAFYFNWREHRISFQGKTTENERLEASNQIIALLDFLDGYPVIRTFGGPDPLRSEIYDSYYTTNWASNIELLDFLEYVKSQNIPLSTPVVVHTTESGHIETVLNDLHPHSYETITFIRIFAAAEEYHQSDYTWERRDSANLIGIASSTETADPLSVIYERTTESQFNPDIMNIINQFRADLDTEEQYD